MTIALIWAAATLGVTAMLCLAGLKAWRGWLELRRHEIASRRQPSAADDDGLGKVIEVADIRERLRKLEAIATGVDL